MRLSYILNSFRNNEVGPFFLDAPGGTEKTFLLNLLLADIRYLGHIALAMASSDIAATLLDNGNTAHYLLKLPLNIAEQETPTVI